VLGCFSSGLLNSAFYAIGPVFCYQIGLTIPELSLVMTVTILGGMLLQWPMGTISDKFDRTYVLAFIGLLTTLISVAILFLAGESFFFFLLLMSIFGGLLFTLYPVSVARAHDVFDTKDIVPVSSALLLSYGAGASIGPILASTVMSLTDAYGLFTYCSIVAALYALITFYLRNRQIITVVAAEDNSAFVVMKNTTPVAAAIDPRSEMIDDFDDEVKNN